MKQWVWMAWLAASLAACGHNRARAGGDPGEGIDAGTSEGDRDAGIDGPPTPTHLTIHTGEPPALLAFRDEASAQWQTVDVAGRGTFDLAVHGPYRVVIACPRSAHGAHVTQYARTLDDPPLIEHICSPPRGLPFHVRGEMAQEGEVFIGGSGRGQSQAPWAFDLPASGGIVDVLLWFGSLTTGFDRVAIRRDLELTGDLDLGTIDVAQEPSHALESLSIAPLNREPGETLSSELIVQLGDATSFVSGSYQPEVWRLTPIPAGILRPSDSQRVQLQAQLTPSDPAAQQTFRSVTRPLPDADEAAVQLMPLLTGARFETTPERAVATWSTLPAHDALTLTRDAFTDDFARFSTHELVITRGFLVATGATSATLDLTGIPGVGPEWALDPALQQNVSLDATRDVLDEHAQSAVSENLAAPVTTPAARRASAAAGPVRWAHGGDQSPAQRAARARAWRALTMPRR